MRVLVLDIVPYHTRCHELSAAWISSPRPGFEAESPVYELDPKPYVTYELDPTNIDDW